MTNRFGRSRGSSWYGITDTSRASGEPRTPANRFVSSVRKYACASPSHDRLLLIDVAGHISRSRGRNDAVIESGSTLSTSSRMTTPGSSSGANIVCRTVNAECA